MFCFGWFARAGGGRWPDVCVNTVLVLARGSLCVNSVFVTRGNVGVRACTCVWWPGVRVKLGGGGCCAPVAAWARLRPNTVLGQCFTGGDVDVSEGARVGLLSGSAIGSVGAEETRETA